jgi:hypothetical protein
MKMFAADERRHAAIPNTVGNNQILGDDISSFSATELLFADPVHHLEVSEGPPSRTERAKPQAVFCTPFNESVILLEEVIEIRYRP